MRSFVKRTQRWDCVLWWCLVAGILSCEEKVGWSCKELLWTLLSILAVNVSSLSATPLKESDVKRRSKVQPKLVKRLDNSCYKINLFCLMNLWHCSTCSSWSFWPLGRSRNKFKRSFKAVRLSTFTLFELCFWSLPTLEENVRLSLVS